MSQSTFDDGTLRLQTHPYIITVASEKGGVGKTTLATNLAIYLKAMREDLPVTIISFDNHFTIDLMFKINEPKVGGTVRDLLMGRPMNELFQLGQYGVGYIPSSTELENIQYLFGAPMALARLLAGSGVAGIVIIDTRPELNVFTLNALYAADQVLVPVKDLPSLENCKNIFALFDRYGIEKKSLTLLPCLIDGRIRFEGAHRDQKSLLQSLAADRGYHCLDLSISKSPKVESLGTNPDGKIYPILTHARGTEVFKQYALLTRHILREFDATREPRCQYNSTFDRQRYLREKDAYLARLESLAERCPICGVALAEGPERRRFYYETSDGVTRGFLHNDCFVEMLCGTLYGPYDHSQGVRIARPLIIENACKSVSLFMPGLLGDVDILDFRQFDPACRLIFRREVPLAGFAGEEQNKSRQRLHLLLNQAQVGFAGRLRAGSWLAVHPVDPANPEKVLREDNYQAVRRLQTRIVDSREDAYPSLPTCLN